MNIRSTFRFVVFLCSAFVVLAFGNSSHGQIKGDTETEKPVLVHYMPWYGSKPVSGTWGWHWTMDHFDPEKVDDKDRRDIASHYYPLIGPYDSSDPDVLDCQVQLMKLAGIDGIVIDWYGIEEHWDYGVNHRNSILMVEKVKQAGLKFAICYEDQTIQPLVDAKKIKPGEEVAHGRKVLTWLESNWFKEEAYVKLDGKPILMVFGPMRFKQADWDLITEGMKTKPVILGLPHLSTETSGNAYGWPPVTGGKETNQTDWTNYLNDLYGRTENGNHVGGIAFAQFHDVYEQAKNKPSFGSLKARNGKTFDETLQRALNSNADFVQIATWNDFGEGTMIEPTREFGYRYLEKLQSKLIKQDSGSPTAQDLRIPIEVYQARKSAIDNEQALAELEAISNFLLAGKYQTAREALAKFKSKSKAK